jgi:transcriptional regulator with XRE-family HTH domain
MPGTLGTFIRGRRKALGLSQEQLAERLGDGVRQSEISRLERNRIALPRRGRLEQLALALDVSIGELLMRSGWLSEEHVPLVSDGTPADDSSFREDLLNLRAAFRQVATIRQLVDEVSQRLDEAERSIATILGSLAAQPDGEPPHPDDEPRQGGESGL